MFQAITAANLFLFVFFLAVDQTKIKDPSVDPMPDCLVKSSVKIEKHYFDHTHYGSGTYIARENNRDFFITCQHVLDAAGTIDEPKHDAILLVKLPEGLIVLVEKLAGDKEKDLALVATIGKVSKTKLLPVVLAKREFAEEEPFWQSGYPEGGNQMCRNGYFIQKRKVTNPKSYHFKQISNECKIICFHGDSGSGIFDAKERLLGIVWGINGWGSTEVIGSKAIVEFLRAKCGKIIPKTCASLP